MTIPMIWNTRGHHFRGLPDRKLMATVIPVKYLRQILLFTLVVLICAGIMYFEYQAVETKTIDRVNSEQAVHAALAAEGIERYFSEYNRSLAHLAENTHVAAMDNEGFRQIRAYYEGHSGQIRAISRTDSSGHLVYTWPEDPGSIGSDISWQLHIRKLLATHEPVVSDVFTAVQGYRTIAFHMPVFVNGTFAGSVAVLIPFDAVSEQYLAGIRVLDTGSASLISSQGVILYSPDKEWIGRNILETANGSPTHTALAQQAMTGKHGTAVYLPEREALPPYHAKKMQAVYYPVHVIDSTWSVIVATPEREIIATTEEFRDIWILAIVAIIAGGILTSWFSIRAWSFVREETPRRAAEAALRESEEKYRNLMEQANDAIIVGDADTEIIVEANRKAAELIGRSRDELIGQPITVLYPKATPEMEEELRKSIREGKPESRQAFLMHKLGYPIPVEISANTIIVKNRKYAVGIFHDITERAVAEEAIRLANRKLNLLYSVTRHDVLNQITALHGYLELSLENCSDPKLREYLKKQEEIIATIRQQIEFTKGYQEMGVNAPQWQRVSDVIRNATSAPEFSRIAVSADVGGLEVYADPLLEKVFFILADNALKHGRRVTEMRFRHEIQETNLVLIVEDNGEGILEPEKKPIFRSGYGRHTGFGLAYACEILSMTGLSITETGTFGRGARFEIMVPLGAFRFTGAPDEPAH